MTSRSIFLLILKIFYTFLLMFLGQENISWDVLYFLIVITCNIGKTVSVTRKNICEKWSNDAVKTFQRQPSRAVLRKRCCENMQQIYRRTHMPKCDLFGHISVSFSKIFGLHHFSFTILVKVTQK